MPIELKCPCGKRLRAADGHAGGEGQCPACGKLLRIPSRDGTMTASPPASLRPTPDAGGESLAPLHLGEVDEKITAAGCVLAAVVLAVTFGVAVPIVRWRDPETGQPIPRTVAILSPLLIGAVLNGIGMLLLRAVGVRVWVRRGDGPTDPA